MAARAGYLEAVRLLLDEMWSPDIAEQVRRRGHDVIAVAETMDLRGLPDDLIFAIAQRNGYAIVTENVIDFRPLGAAEIQRGRSLTASSLPATANSHATIPVLQVDWLRLWTSYLQRTRTI